MIVVFFWGKLTGNYAAISIPDESVKETCDGETFCVDIELETNTSQIEVFMPQQQSNSFLWCKLRSNEELQCVKDASVEYKRETESLQFCMKFNRTKHSENEVVVKRNGDDYRKISLLPCRAGFKVKAIHNKTHVTVTCEHDVFKLSNSGIKIERENNIVAQCKWNKGCIGAEVLALANGIQFITKYDPKIKYSCAMNGQSVQINDAEQDIPHTTQGPKSFSGSGEPNRLACSSYIILVFFLGWRLIVC